MAGEYDEKFEQLTTVISRVVGRVDELRLEMRDMSSELRSNTTQLGSVTTALGSVKTELRSVKSELGSVTTRLGSLESKVNLLSAQFTDVASMAIKDHPRIDNLEQRVGALESETH
ncbi:MAG: hypothetical protein WBD22_06880 [Pyrinomonadaceae bacterium]